jgi:hypothetical protein
MYRLIAAVEECFLAFDPNKLNRAFLSLFQNYNMVLINDGGNHYAVPHMGKDALERAGELPESIRVLMMEVPADEYFHGFANENEAIEDVDNNFEDLILIDELDDEEEDELRGVGVEITY